MKITHIFPDILTKARSSILSHRNQVTQWSRSPTASADPAVTPSFPLTLLPQELTEIIYIHSLASGNTSVLRLSHQSSQVASRFLFSAGAFRIDMQEHDEQFSIRSSCEPSPAIVNSIQNVEIRIDLDSPRFSSFAGSPVDNAPVYSPAIQECGSTLRPYSNHTPGPLALFMDPTIQRDTCIITLRSQMHLAHYYKPEYVLSQIQRLRGFKTVIVRAIAGDGHHLTIRPIAIPRSTNPALSLVRVREKLMCEMVRGELEEVFGPGVMHKNGEWRRWLEFHPMRH